jgi:hypothetical protein
MTPPDDEYDDLIAGLKSKARYAGSFEWPDRNIKEWGVVDILANSLESEGKLFFLNHIARAQGNDPPDCEASDSNGERIAIEVTELVDGDAIRRTKNGEYVWLEWGKEKFLGELASRIIKKDTNNQKEAPYPGGYIVIVHTDEPFLHRETVRSYLEGHFFEKTSHIDRAFLLLSYHPEVDRKGNYPLFEINFK